MPPQNDSSTDREALLQGTLDLLILRILVFGPRHGQGIARSIQQQSEEWQAQFDAEVKALSGTFDPATEELETIELCPSKTNINVRLVALVWLPFRQEAAGIAGPAW